MEVRVTVFERKLAGALTWHTIGLGALDRIERGPNALKLQQRMITALGVGIAKLWPEQLEALELVPGRRLEKVTLELTLGDARRRFRGDVPLVLEPRERGDVDDETPLWLAYHPLRPSEWFVHADGRTLADEATAYFRERWAELDAFELEALRVRGRESLRIVAFGARPRSLLDKLAREVASSGFAELGGGGRKRGTALLAEIGRAHV